MRRMVFTLLLLAVMLGVSGRVSAQTCSATASSVNFGSVSPISRSAVSATGTVSVTCTWPVITLTPYVQVCLNLGGTSPRSLVNGTNQMQYDLYQDSAHSLAWGSIYYGTTPIPLTLTKPALGTSATQSVTIYGQIASNQPTVPTVGNSSTIYTQTFGGTSTSINYGFYLLGAPSCTSLTSAGGSFPFSVSATVVNNCNITATNISFAASSVLNSALSATGSITAQCTNSDAYRIALNGGISGNVVARTMQRSGGGGAVNYQLYTDAAHTTTWGDGTAGTTMVTATGSGNQQVISVYGVVPPQTTPAPGSYSDTITATISF
ncbi:spore coat protein U domain-containing protein [Paraburkholderia megapolitana]|uniref:Spore coat protein U (SCPU) domain-containing protein n=2 Tax=Paraburkholderia megapolitana TaxID=420953 RepID=A0A1I3Q573_9BURK|nr:spore coat protein U domain-containing protein [Paraburkholderia megapolitana]SFJ28286.1 Spore coat protein U (SCPU) domain-containing protein [Paraburkholderia megapolitana]